MSEHIVLYKEEQLFSLSSILVHLHYNYLSIPNITNKPRVTEQTSFSVTSDLFVIYNGNHTVYYIEFTLLFRQARH